MSINTFGVIQKKTREPFLVLWHYNITLPGSFVSRLLVVDNSLSSRPKDWNCICFVESSRTRKMVKNTLQRVNFVEKWNGHNFLTMFKFYSIRSDEGPTLETSTFQIFRPLSTRLIKSICSPKYMNWSSKWLRLFTKLNGRLMWSIDRASLENAAHFLSMF